MAREWVPSRDLIEELGLDVDDYYLPPGTMGFQVMGGFNDPDPHRPHFRIWRRNRDPNPMSFPDVGALLNWVAQGLSDDEVEDLFREIHQIMDPIFVIATDKIKERWRVTESEDGYLIAFRSPA